MKRKLPAFTKIVENRPRLKYRKLRVKLTDRELELYDMRRYMI